MGKKTIVSAVLILLMLLPTTAFGARSQELDSLETYFDDTIPKVLEKENLANMAITVVQDGETVYAGGFGYRDLDESVPVDPETSMFRIGSTTKLFTWTAVLQLEEEGLLDLDQDVNDYLDFEIPNQLEHPRTVDTEPITLRHLMDHTPGFEDYMSRVFRINQQDHQTLEEIVKNHRPARVFHPGEVRAYSNYGTTLAGYIVQRVSGMDYNDYIDQQILQPLEMNYSTTRQPVVNHHKDHLAKPYRWVDGEFLPGEFEYVSEPAGSMSASAVDMAKFMKAFLEGTEEPSILSTETIEKIFTEESTHHDSLRGTSYGFLKATYNNRDAVEHSGGMMLYDSSLFMIPEENLGFFIVHSGGSYRINQEIFEAFINHYFPEEDSEHVAAAIESGTDPSSISGQYFPNRRSFTDTDAILSLLFGPINIATGDDGTLQLTQFGTTHQYIEVDHGVFQNISDGTTSEYGAMDILVFDTDSEGRQVLMADGPMSYSRAAWYETATATIGFLLFALLVILGSFLYWTVKGGIGLIRRKIPLETGISKGAKALAYIQGLMVVIFLGSFLIEGEPNPVYGLPTQAYTPPGTAAMLIDRFLPILMAAAMVATVVFALLQWVKGDRRILPRIHYSVFAAASAVLVWVFYYWNIL